MIVRLHMLAPAPTSTNQSDERQPCRMFQLSSAQKAAIRQLCDGLGAETPTEFTYCPGHSRRYVGILTFKVVLKRNAPPFTSNGDVQLRLEQAVGYDAGRRDNE